MRLVAIGYEYATGCHDNGNVGLHVCEKFHEHTYTVLCAHNVIHVYTSPEAGCYWLRICYVAMTMVMLDYMCVQSFMSTHTQCFMLIVKDKVIFVHRLRLVAIGYECVTLP